MKQNAKQKNYNTPNSKISNQGARGLKTYPTITISNSEIAEFIKLQTSDEASFERHAIDFSKGQFYMIKEIQKLVLIILATGLLV